MPENPEIFQPMTNLKQFEQMTDVYGVAIDVQLVRTFPDGRGLGVGYDLGSPGTWFVYDRENPSAKWHKHCGPYLTYGQAKDWSNRIRESRLSPNNSFSERAGIR